MVSLSNITTNYKPYNEKKTIKATLKKQKYHCIGLFIEKMKKESNKFFSTAGQKVFIHYTFAL